MKSRYYSSDINTRSNRIIRCRVKPVRHVILAGEDKTGRGKPASEDTCAELLEKDDNNPGILSADQRVACKIKAGDKYKKRDPYEKRKDESVNEYVRRIGRINK